LDVAKMSESLEKEYEMNKSADEIEINEKEGN
jgi:hypothetical protein